MFVESPFVQDALDHQLFARHIDLGGIGSPEVVEGVRWSLEGMPQTGLLCVENSRVFHVQRVGQNAESAARALGLAGDA